MILFDYKSSELFLNKKSYKLSSVIGEDNFYFGLFELPQGTLRQAKFISNLPENFYLDDDLFASILERENLMNESIKKASFSIQSPSFIMIPDFLAEKIPESEIARDISAVGYDIRYKLSGSSLDQFQSVFFFLEPTTLVQKLSGFYTETKISHLNSILINQGKSMNGQFLLLHIYGQTLQTVLMDHDRLLQSNDYCFQSSDDVLYYALLSLKNHGLDPGNTIVYYTGMVKDDGPLTELLAKHIRNLQLLDNKTSATYSNVFLGKQKSYFFSLECLYHEDHQR